MGWTRIKGLREQDCSLDRILDLVAELIDGTSARKKP
jgi:hypothetical protein